ncbi:LacI family DNA-binding transcriptional regulator [Ktedonobacter racemifer]|uniref:Transcriptional regulator, LacI family n=1 Tax=Ktedonobacter racemifer DSM 44963 TaxID=485913 RepID=D6U7V7_KTERA|nr:LacI family DNA-binding transcriptional regulator [Ktedonobacter racemifer]EFH79968.1 transcriptional regulator, LacI family [Ktedonobacter racemifer DSM 44963]
MATIKDVAQRAGLGLGTVSRVLNGSGYVSDEARQRVLDAIRDLNYVPNAQARAMMTKRTMTLGVALPDLTNPYFPAMVRGIEDEARRNGYTVTLLETDWQPANERLAIDILRRQSVDGTILVDVTLSDLLTNILLAANIPVVLIGRGTERQDVPHITVNNYKGATEAMQWIFSKGHRRIGFLAGPEHAASAKQRLRAYLDCMGWEALLGDELEKHPELPIAQTDYSFEKGREATEQLLREHPDLTCIFAVNDMTALGALAYLTAQRISVPDTVAVIGFDDVLMASLVHPPLTTMRQPVYDMGAAGARFLIERLKNAESEVQRLVFDPVLVVRQSC